MNPAGTCPPKYVCHLPGFPETVSDLLETNILPSKFFGELSLERIKPHNDNVFLKGRDPKLEQYSGFDSHNLRGERILNYATKKVVISGIATEYCVKESCMELLKAGYDVYINRENLAYVNFEGHLKALKEMELNGAMII